MADKIDFTSVNGFQSYVQTYADSLISKLFFGFKSGMLFTTHEGVKGKKLLTELQLGTLVRRYSKTFAAIEAGTFVPRNLEVADAKVDLQIVPKDFEDSYAGMWRKKGQNPMDYPFQAYIMDKLIAKIMEEMEIAFWQAEAAAVPASDDELIETFDGLVRIISDEVIATNLTAYTTGALTNANIVGHIEGMYNSLGPAYKSQTMDIFISLADRTKYIQNYRGSYGMHVGDNDVLKFDLGPVNFHVLPGVPENFVLITPASNIHYGYDGNMDHSLFNFEQEDRKLKMWCDFKMGVQVGIVSDDCVVVNDHALLA